MNDTISSPAARPSNPMGLTGFIISLVSLVGCGGLLSPVSLIFSLIGLGREPRAFAIAGLVLSLIGLLGFVFLFLFGGLALLLVLVGLGVAAAGALLVGAVGPNAFVVLDGIHDFYEANDRVPAALTELDLPATDLTDTWGNRFVYIPSDDAGAFILISAGPDEAYGTGDDHFGRIRLRNGFNFNIGQGYDDIKTDGWAGDLRARVIAEGEVLPALPADPGHEQEEHDEHGEHQDGSSAEPI